MKDSTLTFSPALPGSASQPELTACEPSPCASATQSAKRSLPKRGRESRFWPDVRTFGSLSSVWLLTAGVPCQPASRAGKQRGSADDRWLWPDALRVFAALRPAWALFENPAGIGDVGLAGILSQVEAQGYAVLVFSIPACAVGSPHRRERYWIVCKPLANASETRRERPDAEPGTDGLHPENILKANWPTPEASVAEHGGPNQRDSRPRRFGG